MLEIVKSKIEDIISLLENTGYFLINEQEKHEYKTFTKDDKSLLTELDVASEILIKNELTSLFGNIKVLSEENSQEENEQIAKEKFCFLLDPIDGTKNFDKGKDFTINLAFCVNKKPVIGFIHNPKQKTILFGDKEQAFKRVGGKTTKLQKIEKVSKYDLVANGNQKPLKIAIGTHNFANKDFVDALIKEVQQCGYNFTSYGLKAFSAMEKLLSFVNGEVDAFWTTSMCKDWDVLPALPILEGIKADYYTENPTLFKDCNFNSGYFIVAKGEELLDDLIGISTKISDKIVLP